MDDIKILYEDKHLILCEKPAGTPSQPDLSGLGDVLTKLSEKYRDVKLVHRLDIPTGGVMVYAKNGKSAAKLSELFAHHDVNGDNGMAKTYLAVLSSEPDFDEGELCDLLFHDKQKNKSFVVDSPRKGVKKARLIWKKLAVSDDGYTLISVTLLTGRTHQVRVQFASRGRPLCGDGKYGSLVKCPFVALWSHSISFVHPFTGKKIKAVSTPHDISPWNLFDINTYM